MTNSEDEPLNTLTGTVVETTAGTDKYISNKGTEFEIQTQPNGLFKVHMKKGGLTPALCEELFTSHRLASRALELYLSKGDRLGYAEYPSKKRKNAESKTQ